MEEKPEKHTLAENQTEFKTTANNKPLKVIILLLTIICLISLTISALFKYNNNVLKKQLNEITINNTSDDNTTNSDKSVYPTHVSTDAAKQIHNATHLQVDSCSSESCLFVQEMGTDIGTPEGFGKIQGYYNEYETDDWGTLTTCTGFVVTGGNETLILHFNDWIESGNNLNKIIDGKLVANINLDNIDDSDKNLILTSNEDSQVELGVLRITPVGRGVSACSSVINIVSAKEIPDKVN